MLLDVAGDGIEMARARMAGQRGPAGLRRAGRGDGSLHVGRGALGHARQNHVAGGVAGLEGLAGLGDGAGDEVPRALGPGREPGAGDRRVLGGGAVFHRLQYLPDAHGTLTTWHGDGPPRSAP